MFSSELLDVIRRSQQSSYRINFSSGVVFIFLGVIAIAGSLWATTTNGLKGLLLFVGLVAIAAGVANCIYYRSRYTDVAEILTQEPQQGGLGLSTG